MDEEVVRKMIESIGSKAARLTEMFDHDDPINHLANEIESEVDALEIELGLTEA